jgi:two-component sensor histidine kinase
MTGREAPVDLLVVDALAERHDSYRDLLGHLARRVVTVGPGEEARRLLRTGDFAAVLLHLNGHAGAAAGELAAIESSAARPAIIAISSDMPDLAETRASRSIEYVPAAYVSEMLPGRVSCLLELRRLRSELIRRDQRIDELVGEVDLIRKAAADEKRTSDHLKGRVAEQVHRGKNLLAILQSVTRRTISDGRNLAEAREALMGRMRALARAYHLVSASDGQGTEVSDIVEGELADVIDRVTASGPPVRLQGAVVQTFALALHELATNAAQHGALRSPDGSIAVGWTFFEYGADRYLEVAWTEHGGAPPRAPSQYGFGLTLVSSFAGMDTRAPSITFDEGGLVCRMRLSQDVLVAS